MLSKFLKRSRRHARIRARVSGTTARPRLMVYRSNLYIYAQMVDDTTGTTLCAASDIKAKDGNKTTRARDVGVAIAAIAAQKGITTCIFDRGGCLYHGRVKALAEAAREGGLSF